MRFSRLYSAAFALVVVSCNAEPDEAPPASLAAATANLPDTDILIGQFRTDEKGALTVVDIEPAVAGPGYQNQPMMLGPNQGRFYYVAENNGGKTDIWTFEFQTGEETQITDTPLMSEFSPKPAPGERVSYIQESEDGEITQVHAFGVGETTGAPVIDLAPLGYYEWLAGGATIGVFYRSEPPQLRFVDVASGAAETAFDNVGRSFQASPSGDALYVTQADDEGRYRVVRIDMETGDVAEMFNLPAAAQDFRLVFDGEGAPALAFSGADSRLMVRNLRADVEWREAANVSALGYGDITRIDVALSTVREENGETRISHGPIVFVAAPLPVE